MKHLIEQMELILNDALPDDSVAEMVLSVPHSLMLTMGYCQKAGANEPLLHALRMIYIEGARSQTDLDLLNALKAMFLKKNIRVTSTPMVTSEDPTRRYFETHLAFNILQEKAESLDSRELRAMFRSIKERLFSGNKMDDATQIRIQRMLAGVLTQNQALNKYEFEYAELIQKLFRGNYHGLSQKACGNLYFIACMTYLSTLATQLDDAIPVDIYDDSVFNMGMDGRGRRIKTANHEVKTTAKGLMKSTSPLPLYGDAVNPVREHYHDGARSLFMRSVDQAGFMLESAWVMSSFAKQTHPYSNGISSTTLAQLRNLLLQKRMGHPYYGGQFETYFTVFAALMVYNSGGHSLYEITEVLKLPYFMALYEQSATMQQAIHSNNAMYTLFYEQNQGAFEKAFETTRRYSDVLFYKKRVHAELKHAPDAIQIAPYALMLQNLNQARVPSIHQAVLVCGARQFNEVLAVYKGEIDLPNNQGWSALMLAAQLGRVQQIKALIQKGADVSREADGICALSLAIKNSHFEATCVLIDAKAPLMREKKKQGGLKSTAPALFFAVRQRDMRILSRLLHAGAWDLKEIKQACHVALKVENLDALKILLELIPNKSKLLGKRFINQIFNEAVITGNFELIDTLFSLDLIRLNQSKLDELIYTAAKHGYIPLLRYALSENGNTIAKPSQATLDLALSAALAYQQNDTAVYMIIHGANLLNTSVAGCHLERFKAYLQQAQQVDTFLLPSEQEQCRARLLELNRDLLARKNSVFYGLLCHLVAFLNWLLPVELRCTYQDKTDVLAQVVECINGPRAAGLTHQGLFAHRNTEALKEEALPQKMRADGIRTYLK